MRVTKITQRIGRTIQLGDNDYLKIDISKDVELEQVLGEDNAILWEDDKEVQKALYEQIKQEINEQTNDLLKKNV